MKLLQRICAYELVFKTLDCRAASQSQTSATTIRGRIEFVLLVASLIPALIRLTWALSQSILPHRQKNSELDVNVGVHFIKQTRPSKARLYSHNHGQADDYIESSSAPFFVIYTLSLLRLIPFSFAIPTYL